MPEKTVPPKSIEQLISSLPQELRLIGEYIHEDIKTADTHVQMAQEDLDKLLSDPTEAELDLEEENEEFGLSRKDADKVKSISLNPEYRQRELENALAGRAEIVSLLQELSSGSFANVLAYLQRHLDAQLQAEELLPEGFREKLSPGYKEKQIAKKRALQAYIDILKQKGAR